MSDVGRQFQAERWDGDDDIEENGRWRMLKPRAIAVMAGFLARCAASDTPRVVTFWNAGQASGGL